MCASISSPCNTEYSPVCSMAGFKAFNKAAFPDAEERRSNISAIKFQRLQGLYQTVIKTEDEDKQIAAYRQVVQEELESTANTQGALITPSLVY